MQPNDIKELSLIEEAYGSAYANLTHPEQLLINLALANSEDDISVSQVYWVSRDDMIRGGGFPPQATFKDLEAVADALFLRSIDVKPAPGIVHHIWWLSDTEHDVMRNRVGLRFSFTLANFFNRYRSA